MSCMLRAAGVSFDVDAFCRSTSLPVAARHHAGERRNAGSTCSRSSVRIDVSSADFSEMPRQVEDAIAFLGRHAEEVRRLVAFPGVEGAELDFGVAWRDVAAQFDSFPSRLVSLAGTLGSHREPLRDIRPGMTSVSGDSLSQRFFLYSD